MTDHVFFFTIHCNNLPFHRVLQLLMQGRGNSACPCIQGRPSRQGLAGLMAITKEVDSKVLEPTLTGRVSSPSSVPLEPSKALTIISLGLRTNPSISSRSKAVFGRMFRAEPVSTNT